MSEFKVMKVIVERYIVVNHHGHRVSNWYQLREEAEKKATELNVFLLDLDKEH